MSSACYFPDGTNTNAAFVPCNQTAIEEGKHTSCCAPGDMCFTNGICKANNSNQLNWNWRDACTDPTWKDPACPNYCKGTDPGGAHVIFQCQEEDLWCCAFDNPPVGHYNFTCCTVDQYAFRAGKAVFYTTAQLNLGIETLSSIASASSFSTATLVVASTTSVASQSIASSTARQIQGPFTPSVPSATAAPASQSHSLAIGLGVGIPVAILLFAVACFFFWRLGKRAQAKEELPIKEVISEAYSMPAHSMTQQEVARLEIDGDMLKAEMAHPRSPVELEGPRWAPRPPSKRGAGHDNFF
ncbi:uncharacterized protein BDZ99DRAFT_573268 [Mytilinidion resinicola]|uniref:Mid2 domain-containing protein n=1 Tax=Mytilinidion resinicola TaxID=574789 RepID=A0A6A6YF75_9PEZI|nr:uncharacterized protein BDZ99DRAFT_573268 [Mytilinidion resinicola]KAF2807441.1 hypothetical protein BDZ99DRAFT_573268 [Mytilinidion resinicola]